MDDCFDKILKASHNSEVTKYKVIIKLMRDLEDGLPDTLRARNCLLFIINLCFNQEYCDYTDSLGKASDELSEANKNELKNILRWELKN